MPIPAFREDGWLPPGHHAATWEELVTIFGGAEVSRRRRLTHNLLQLRDSLRVNGAGGTLMVNGSYISAQPEPGDFDVLLVASPDIQTRKDVEPSLADLLDAQRAEERGYSLFYISRQFCRPQYASHALGRFQRRQAQRCGGGRVMIASREELLVAVRNLRITEYALYELRAQLHAENPDLLMLTAPAYEERIAVLQADIAGYLNTHPADLSLVLPPLHTAEQPAAA